MRRVAAVVVTLIVALAVASGIAVALAYAGLVPVAADARHSALLEWYLEEAVDHAVDRAAAGVRPPPLDDPALLRLGIVHYQRLCVTCHGAPGVEPSEIGKGLYPEPPLLERKKRLRAAPVYWLVKHGIRDTGMPAFGPTRSEQDLWAVAAFTVAMPHMSAEEYARRAREAGVPEPLSGRPGPAATHGSH